MTSLANYYTFQEEPLKIVGYILCNATHSLTPRCLILYFFLKWCMPLLLLLLLYKTIKKFRKYKNEWKMLEKEAVLEQLTLTIIEGEIGNLTKVKIKDVTEKIEDIIVIL